MEKKSALCRGKISKVVIRQTGKIRAALLGARQQDRSTWDTAMKGNLKKAFPTKTIDYALLPNADEAKMEVGALSLSPRVAAFSPRNPGLRTFAAGLRPPHPMAW